MDENFPHNKDTTPNSLQSLIQNIDSEEVQLKE